MEVKNVDIRFKELIEKLKSEEFYKNRGLANEIPFYIFDYTPEKELSIRYKVTRELLPALEGTKLNAVEIDLFDLLIESLKNDGIFEAVFKMEEKRGAETLYKKLKNSFNMEVILKMIKDKSQGKNMVILTGVGKIYPIMRSHAILNNLQTIFDDTKVLLFFPGEYTSTDLRRFGLKGNNYYRAFKI